MRGVVFTLRFRMANDETGVEAGPAVAVRQARTQFGRPHMTEPRATPDGPGDQTDGPFGVVIRGAAIPRVDISLHELIAVAAMALLALDTLDSADREKALDEARSRVAAFARSDSGRTEPTTREFATPEARHAEIARHVRLSHLGAAALTRLEAATDSAFEAGGIDPGTGKPT